MERGDLMQRLIILLKEIYSILKQIKDITANQTTLLLEQRENIEDEQLALDMLEQMVNYKDEVIRELTIKEEAFEQAYEPYRGKITNSEDVSIIKQLVNSIVQIKHHIVEEEKQNMIIMQTNSRRRIKSIEIPQNPQAVTNAYKNQQIKT